jgi:hypothetical protein
MHNPANRSYSFLHPFVPFHKSTNMVNNHLFIQVSREMGQNKKTLDLVYAYGRNHILHYAAYIMCALVTFE